MKLAIASVFGVATFGIASGIAPGIALAKPITPPPGWTTAPELAKPPAATRFGGSTTKVTVAAYRAPVAGAVLYVERAEAAVPADRRDAVATAELDELRQAMRRQGPATTSDLDVQRFIPASKWLEAAVTWRDPSVGLVDQSVIVVAADATRLVAVTAKCVLAIDVAAAHQQACDAALATIDPEIPLAARVPLAIVNTPVAPAEPATEFLTDAPAGAGATAPDMSGRMGGRPDLGPPARLDDASRVMFPPIPVATPSREVDRRPVYLGGGLVILAVLFYLNRRRREKFEREPGPRRSRSTDQDADDLHAAAAAASDDGAHDER